jgi:hypothetical protein
MGDMIPTTLPRWLAVAVVVTVCGFGLPYAYVEFFGAARPLVTRDITLGWGPRLQSLILREGTREYTTACDEMLISRWILTSRGRVDADARVIRGGLLPNDYRIPPHRVVKTTSRIIRDTVLDITIPDWVLHADPPEPVLGVMAEVSVPSNKPCANGFSGRYMLYQLLIPDAPTSPEDNSLVN